MLRFWQRRTDWLPAWSRFFCRRGVAAEGRARSWQAATRLFIYVGAAPVKRKNKPHRRLQAPTSGLSGYTNPEPDGRQGNAGERPEHRSGGRNGRVRESGSPPESFRHQSDKRKNLLAPPDLLRPVCARPRRSSPLSHLSALSGSMSIFVPGFAITSTAFSAKRPYRADPFSDEDLEAGAGSR